MPPTGSVLTQVQTLAAAGNFSGVATLAVQQPQFYNVTLRNLFAAESNRDNSVFVPLNDYIVTAIGMVHDDVNYSTALSADILYTLKGVSPAASASNNNHYQAADTAVTDISANLVATQQTTAYGYSAASVAGLITTRAGAIQHFDAGTNRRGYNLNIINQTCHQMEQVMDTSLPSDRIGAITERFIERLKIGLRGQHLQIQLRTAQRGQRAFDMRDEPRADAMTSHRFIDRERIHPAAVPIVAAHHGADDAFVEHRDEEQLRLRRELVGDRQMRIALRPRHVPVLGKSLLPQRDHGIGVSRVEAADR